MESRYNIATSILLNKIEQTQKEVKERNFNAGLCFISADPENRVVREYKVIPG